MSQLVTYYNNGSIPLINASELPYDVVNLAFIYSTPNAPFDLILDGAIAASPHELTQATKSAISAMQQNGQKVLISFGGGAMAQNSYQALSQDPNKLAGLLAEFVKANQLDGIDIDFEDTGAFTGTAGYDGAQFLIALTKELRALLPSPQYLITHAPQPPYLQQGSGMDGYVPLVTEVGQDIDWLNVQFYNNPPWSANPQQIVGSYFVYCQLPNMSEQRIVIGLPVTEQDAGSGYMPVSEIVSDIIQPIQQQGTLGGIMNWQFSSDTNGEWIKTINQAVNSNQAVA